MSDNRSPKKNTFGAGKNIAEDENIQTKSNEEILEEIDLLMSQDPECMDTDKITQYLAILQERAPVMEDYDPVSEWNGFADKLPPPVEPDDSDYGAEDDEPLKLVEEPKPGKSHHFIRATEVVVAAVLILVVTASAIGVKPIQTVINWAEGVIQVYSNPSGVMELPSDNPSEYHSLAEALEANGINTEGAPNWIPRDYMLKEVFTQKFEGICKCTAIYKSDRGEVQIRAIHFADDLAMMDEREDGGYVYMSNNIEYYIISNYEQCKAVWQAGNISYAISGQLSDDEIKTMIDSIT